MVSAFTHCVIPTLVIALAVAIALLWPSENQELINAVRRNDVASVHKLVQQQLILQQRKLQHQLPLQQQPPLSSSRFAHDDYVDDAEPAPPSLSSPPSLSTSSSSSSSSSSISSRARRVTIDDISLGSGRTILHTAAMHSKLDIIDYAVRHGADVDRVKPNDGRTPLHYAASYGTLETVQRLIQYGASIHAKTESEWSPLIFSVFFSQVSTVEFLLQIGADPNDRVKDGLSALQTAIVYSNRTIPIMLIEYGAVLLPSDSYYEDFTRICAAMRSANKEPASKEPTLNFLHQQLEQRPRSHGQGLHAAADPEA